MTTSTNTTSTDSPPATSIPPTPLKPRRNNMWLFAAIGAIILGALGAVFLFQSTVGGHQVVAIRSNVDRGAVIKAEDLMSVEITLDPSLRTIPSADMAQLVGRRAARDLASGALITPDSVTEQVLPGRGKTMVGLHVTPAQLPVGELRAGDKIRIVVLSDPAAAPAQGASPAAAGAQPRAIKGTVSGVNEQTQTGNTLVNVVVEETEAAAVAMASGNQKAVIVLDSRER